MRQLNIIIVVLFFFPTIAVAQSVFPAGAASKAAGMESSLWSRDAEAVLYNPANLASVMASVSYLELGFTSVEYQYEHPDFDPVHVTTRSPVASLGYQMPLDGRWSLGVILFPARLGKQEIPGLPRRVADQVVPINVTTSSTLVHLGVGGSYAINPALSVGMSLINSYEKVHTQAELSSTESSLYDLNGHTWFFRPVLGLRYENPWTVATLSLLTPVKKTYKGSQSAAGVEGSPTAKEYLPLTINTGAKYKVNPMFEFGLQLSYANWASGKNAQSSGITPVEIDADLHNTFDWGLAFKYLPTTAWSILASYSQIKTPWGDGVYNPDDVTHTKLGVEFGQLNGMDKKVYGLGAGYEFASSFAADLAFYYAKGSRVTSSTAYSEGFYKLDVICLTTAIRKSF